MGNGRSCFGDNTPGHQHENGSQSQLVQNGQSSISLHEMSQSKISTKSPSASPSSSSLSLKFVWIRWANDPIGCEVEIPYNEELSIYQLKRKIARRCRRPVRPEVLQLSLADHDGAAMESTKNIKNVSERLNRNTLTLSSALPHHLQDQPADFVIIVTDPSSEEGRPRGKSSRPISHPDDEAALDLLELDGLEVETSSRASPSGDYPPLASSSPPVSVPATPAKEEEKPREEKSEAPAIDRITSEEDAKQTESTLKTDLLRGGWLVSKYTWNKGTKRERMFFLDLGEGAEKNDLSAAAIYWVKKKSRHNPQKDKKARRTIFLAEISNVTKGKQTYTFTQGDAKSAIETHCMSIHFKAVAVKPTGTSPKSGGGESDDEEEPKDGQQTVEIPRTLDVEVQSEEQRDEIARMLQQLSKLARRHAKKKRGGSTK